MTFDGRDLRRGKDVFAVDGTYLGTVVWTIGGRPAGRQPIGHQRPADRTRTGEVSGETSGDAGPAFSGEALGPMPTSALGNTGPSRQSTVTAYATRSPSDLEPQPAELVVLRLLTSLDWSTLRPRLWRIPVGLVQSVSHERIVLSVTAGELEARRSPSPRGPSGNNAVI